MTTTMQDMEIFAFVAGVFCGATEGRNPISVGEAEYTINAWKEEGIELPEGLNAFNFSYIWNDLIGGQKHE